MQNNNRNIKKRTYSEAFGTTNNAPYKLKYFNTNIKDLYDLYFKFENIKLVYINIQEEYKYENLLTHLFAKILTKLNLHYEKFLIYTYSKHSHKNNKKDKYIKNKDKNNNILNENKTDFSCVDNNKDKNNKDNNNNDYPNNNENNLNIIPIQNYFINQELYPLIRNFKNINPDNLNIINITGDGNCLFRSLSYFFITLKIIINK